MTIEVLTETGSLYRINYDNKTWERLEETPMSGRVRTDSGPWNEVIIVEGFPMLIEGPPLDPTMWKRQITTSIVVSTKPVE